MHVVDHQVFDFEVEHQPQFMSCCTDTEHIKCNSPLQGLVLVEISYLIYQLWS